MNPEMLEQYLNNAPMLKKYRNMSPERARFIENITQHIKYYMNEIEYNLRSGLSLINEVKAEGREDSDEIQAELFDIVKNVEQCTTGIQRVLEQDGAPSYYLLHGRIAVFDNGMPIDSFVLHGDDDDDSSSDDSDDEDGTKRIMRRFGIRPAAQISFTITQNGDNISVSPIETVFNNGFSTLTSAPVEEPTPAPVEAPVSDKKERKPRAKKAVATALENPVVPSVKSEIPSVKSEIPSVKKERKPRAKKAVNTTSETMAPALEPAPAPALEPAAVPKKRGRPKKVSTETV